MQIDYYNSTSQEWEFDKSVVNETTPRTINSGNVLGLDTIFNAQNVNTSSFSHGNGTYHVYAAFRDPDGNLLRRLGDSEFQENEYIEAWYPFTVTYD